MSTPDPAPPPTATAQPDSGRYADEYRFVAQVRHICRESPGARAALRSGLGKPVDRCERMHWVVAGLVPEKDRGYESERPYYAIASMIAAAPASQSDDKNPTDPAVPAQRSRTSPRTLGECLADAVDKGSIRESGAEAKLQLLTRQSTGGLHRHLPPVMRLLDSRLDIGDWVRLLADLRAWETNRQRVARRWLQSFYRRRLRTEQFTAEQADTAEHAQAPAAP
ncbi:type I-E CRISPR-associated protein Cse2/CasB [Streptomyces sp. NPDC055400]